ncbi:MAG: tetratricopeptide repeat protein [Actinomycetota bacterium]
MIACTEPGCGGTILSDGYCDTCGVRHDPNRAAPAASTGAAAAVGGASTVPDARSGSTSTPGPATAGQAVGAPATGSGSASSGGSSTPAGGPSNQPVVPASAGPVPQATPSLAPSPIAGGAVRPAGSACGRDGCIGTIAPDGYCDICGLAATSSGGPVVAPALNDAGDGADLGSLPAIAIPSAPDTSSRLPGAGTATARSRSTSASRRTASVRTGIGAGLVSVAPTTVGDPGAAVMSDAEIQAELGIVPEEERFCSACGDPVGRAYGDRDGRVKGFCGSCRAEFDFVTNEPSLRRGELVAGQYEIAGALAHGGMGWIYLGRDRAVSNRWVVLKGLLNDDDPDAVAAAVAERRFLAQIDHANIVNIYNFVTHRGSGYIVMEMVGGESLNAKLKARRKANGGVPNPLPVTDAIAYVLGVLPALRYLHERGLVYNDLKPANVMAVGEGVKLIDVGAVMRIDDRQAAIFGTPGFQAPEVATTGPSVASDLYTVGRTLAVLIIRFVFHDGPYLYALPPPSEAPLLAQWESLYRFLLRATAFHPDDRFQTAPEMAEQLTGVLREIVALTAGRARPTASQLFEGDRLADLLVAGTGSYEATTADWRVLPAARVDEDDPAAPFLLGLPDGDPVRTVDAIRRGLDRGEVSRSNEVSLRLAWELIQLNGRRPNNGLPPGAAPPGGAADDPERVLREVEASNPWEWRVHWYRAIHQLQLASPAVAAEGFSRVWTELPGETAPKIAVALAAELAGEDQRALELYDLVISADSTFVSAAFGMARCNWRLRDHAGAVAAFNRVPTSSAAHGNAQVAAARTLVAGGTDGTPDLDDLQAASATIERLQLDAAERAALAADIFERALVGVEAGRIQGGSQSILGRELTEKSLREGLEQTYRTQARLATSPDERVRLVDLANSVRPRSLF